MKQTVKKAAVMNKFAKKEQPKPKPKQKPEKKPDPYYETEEYEVCGIDMVWMEHALNCNITELSP